MVADSNGLKLFVTLKLAAKLIELYNNSLDDSESAAEEYRRFLLDEGIIQAWDYHDISGNPLPLELASFEQMDLDDLRDLNSQLILKINPAGLKKSSRSLYRGGAVRRSHHRPRTHHPPQNR
jgi:hypothetical protein